MNEYKPEGAEGNNKQPEGLPKSLVDIGIDDAEQAANASVGRAQESIVNVDAIVPVGDIEPGRVERLMHAASKLGSAALQTSRTALEQLPFGGASVSWHPEQSDSSGQKEE